MTDVVVTGTLSGSVSARNVDTIEYRAEVDIDDLGIRSGEKFKFWPYGTSIGWIIDRGPVVLNSQIAEWEKAGVIVRTDKQSPALKAKAPVPVEPTMEPV